MTRHICPCTALIRSVWESFHQSAVKLRRGVVKDFSDRRCILTTQLRPALPIIQLLCSASTFIHRRTSHRSIRLQITSRFSPRTDRTSAPEHAAHIMTCTETAYPSLALRMLLVLYALIMVLCE